MTRALLWIALALAGCDDTVFPNGGVTTKPGGDTETPDSGGSRYHPPDQANPDVHGLDARLQVEACASCHGADLTGAGDALSCDSCHAEGWRTDCTFCHGGTDNETGAPPREIDDNTDESLLSYRPHTEHVTEGDHPAFDCSTCHTKPTDVLSEGHIFIGDDSPGAAEVSFSGGLSDAGTYDGAGTCGSLYCHGYRGRDNGEVSHTDGARGCDDCHPDTTSGRSAWDSDMSGEHEKHLREGVKCSGCHEDTVSSGLAILDPSLHVNGTADVTLASGMTRDSSGRCTGTCHNAEGEAESHESESW